MCGLTGFWLTSPGESADALRDRLHPMVQSLAHRGPDDHGLWVDPAPGLALGHTRLSIVDLSPAGHQPMASACGRFHLVFNGEVYNHAPLRDELRQHGETFRGTSDTEVLLAGFRVWGIAPTIERCIGMFAMALWDARERTLTLVRDRMGIKPLYYGQLTSRGQTAFVFGSELKSLRAWAGVAPTINRQALSEFLRFGYVPSPHCIDDGLQQLRPGTMLRLTSPHDRPEPATYWSFRETTTQARQRRGGATCQSAMSIAQAADELEPVLTDAIGLRMLADVPLGAFLSGGIDSSLVVSLMQRQSSRPIKTFSIGFEDPAYDEAPFARAVATHLGTDHTEQIVTAQQAQDVVPLLPTLYDEPFADSSQIPTYLVSRLAREHVTVSLSGDGGDELFCGYRRYFDSLWLQRWQQRVPDWGSRALSGLAGGIAPWLPQAGLQRRARRAASLLAPHAADRLYLQRMAHWMPERRLVLGLDPLEEPLEVPANWPRDLGRPEAWMWYDAQRYLPDDILTKVDRASMAVGLEARVPLIDHRVVELAWSLPMAVKTDGRTGKLVLRELLARHVPRALFERPKVGFGVPLAGWLRGPLREWADDLLAESRLKREGYLDPAPIGEAWRRHTSGGADLAYPLWTVLMFQAWLAHWGAR